MKMYIHFDYSVKKQKSINRIFENFGRLDSQLWIYPPYNPIFRAIGILIGFISIW